MSSAASVTIHIPVYNEKDFISQTIESAINQTYRNIKILITDNCSTDGSFEIAADFAAKDNRIQLIKHAKNIGASENFKQGALMSSTDYFCWLGGHDIFLPEYIERAIVVLENSPGVAMVYPISRFIDKDGNLLELGGSDIDTTSEKYITNKIYKVANNLSNCVAIHGVFRTQVVKNFPFVKTIGPDLLMLFSTLNWGDIYGVNYEGIYRREVRGHETLAQTIQRFIEFGIFKQSSVNPYALLVVEHYNYLLKNFRKLSYLERLRIIRGLQRIFHTKFGVKLADVIRVYLKLYK